MNAEVRPPRDRFLSGGSLLANDSQDAYRTANFSFWAR